MALDRESSEYAEYRAVRAAQRGDRWSAEAQRLYDRADTMRSKSWRTRVLREAERADRLARRARTEASNWQAEAVVREAEELADRGGVGLPDEYDDDVADEFFLTLEYEADSGRGSDVDIQLHVRRVDGAPMTAREAQHAFSVIRSQGAHEPPPGYEFAGIDWRRPHKASSRWTTGRNVDVAVRDFFSVLLLAPSNAYRFGGLKS